MKGVPRLPSTFRVSDVRRAVQGAESAGLAVSAVAVTREGRIEITATKPAQPPAATERAPEAAE
jgi:hypothetical protein